MRLDFLSLLRRLLHRDRNRSGRRDAGRRFRQSRARCNRRAKTFSPNKIRRELSVSAEFLLAADPDGPLYGCVAATERLVRTGYRNSGFPDVQVKASADMKARAIVVRVKEGPRYLAGEIRVRGNKAIPLAQLIARLTQPYPPGNALPRSPREGRGQSGTCWVDRNGNNVELSDPVWSPGKPAAFPASANDWKLHGDAFNALGDLGFFRARFSVDVVVNPATKKADLVIDISKEGPRSEFASVMITGNEANSRQEILKCIGFRTGLPATRDQLAAIQERLWRSGRFIKSQVTLIRPATPADGAVLSINVSELHGAPPLGKPLTPEEAILLKCRDWLVNSDRWGGDFVCQCDAAEGSLRAVFSPGNGMFATIKCNSRAAAETRRIRDRCIAGRGGILRSAGQAKTGRAAGKWAIGGLRCDPTGRRRQRGKSGGRGKLSFGFGIKSERSQWTLPLDLILSLDPVCFLDMVHWRETKCTVETRCADPGQCAGPVASRCAVGKTARRCSRESRRREIGRDNIKQEQADRKVVAARIPHSAAVLRGFGRVPTPPRRRSCRYRQNPQCLRSSASP